MALCFLACPSSSFSCFFTGWKKEIDLFVNCLEAFNHFGQRHMLAFEGMRGSGKSQLLNHLAQLGQCAGCRVFGMELLEVNVRQSFSAIRILMARVLGLQECESCSAREHVLQTNLKGIIEESNYCLLNDIFLVKLNFVKELVFQVHDSLFLMVTRAKLYYSYS
ncbi:hypothetical protein AAES_03866 [Amazona aestiva]|uniref:Uncharacterized protein n=1 Tax=Amazona aestiva TaxID=12930 RepID=A0A0Q3XAK2_AMAAE|nr:hypothetical protein AAES_03866 [Amazona aestiva]